MKDERPQRTGISWNIRVQVFQRVFGPLGHTQGAQTIAPTIARRPFFINYLANVLFCFSIDHKEVLIFSKPGEVPQEDKGFKSKKIPGPLVWGGSQTPRKTSKELW